MVAKGFGQAETLAMSPSSHSSPVGYRMAGVLRDAFRRGFELHRLGPGLVIMEYSTVASL